MARAKKPRRLYFQKYFEKNIARQSASLQKNKASDDCIFDDVSPLLLEDIAVRADEFIKNFYTSQELAEIQLAPHVILMSRPGTLNHTVMMEFATARHETLLLIAPQQNEPLTEPKLNLSDKVRELIERQVYPVLSSRFDRNEP